MLVTSPAASGGGSVFEFNRSYFVPGDEAVGRTSFTARIKGQPRIEDGPWYAYLVPGDMWLRPPRIPPAAIPLGLITIVDRTGDVNALARIRFVVPDVDPGGYSVGICDDPCRDAYVGDLIGGWFNIAATREEAQLMHARDRLIERLRTVRFRLRREARQVERELGSELASLEVENSVLSRDVGAAEAALAGLRRDRSPSPLTIAGWGIAAMLLVGLVIVVKRRQTAVLLAPFQTSNATPAPDLEEVLK
ncbi:MAG: hypothetical protein ACRDH6_09180 [Actinomycetota bacterium]